MAPAASLVIAVYNRAEVVEFVFASLVNQSMSDFEIVIADDGSGPEIAALIAALDDERGRRGALGMLAAGVAAGAAAASTSSRPGGE